MFVTDKLLTYRIYKVAFKILQINKKKKILQ